MIQKDADDATISDIMEAKYGMFDALGIMQHHDAIVQLLPHWVGYRYQGWQLVQIDDGHERPLIGWLCPRERQHRADA